MPIRLLSATVFLLVGCHESGPLVQDPIDEPQTAVTDTPLGITDWHWYGNAENHPHKGGGLHLRSLDMLKFGQLFLDRGLWDGTRIVPEAWVDSSFVQHVTFRSPSGPGGRITGYGYLWWIMSPDPGGDGVQPIYAAMGYRGQYVFIAPETDLVVVVTGWMPVADSQKPMEFLYTDILPAIVQR